METKKEMTIDKLAEIIQREFIVAQNERRSIQSDIGSIQSEIINMKRETGRKFEIVDERFRQNLDTQDKIMNSLANLETDNEAGAGASRRQTDKLDNHEERIVVVEKKLGLKMAV